MLILEQELLLFVEQKTRQNANINASFYQTAYVQLTLDIFNSLFLQA